MSGSRTDGRVEKGDQTRRAVLRRAADIASLEGLEGLSIGRLAGDLSISKSGVFAHFGSKEELQLATVRAAAEIYLEHVVTPALAQPPGLARLRRLCEGWLAYSRDRVFPGGCFFFNTNAEFDARPGRVRDALAEAGRAWLVLLERNVREAQRSGELPPDPDAAQTAFELVAFLEAANAASVLHDDDKAYERAATAIRTRLTPAAPPV